MYFYVKNMSKMYKIIKNVEILLINIFPQYLLILLHYSAKIHVFCNFLNFFNKKIILL